MEVKDAVSDHAASDERRKIALFETSLAKPGIQFASPALGDLQPYSVKRFHPPISPCRLIVTLHDFHTGIVRYLSDLPPHVSFDTREQQYSGREILRHRQARMQYKRDGD